MKSLLFKIGVGLSLGMNLFIFTVAAVNLKMFGTLGPVLLTLTCSVMALEIMGIE